MTGNLIEEVVIGLALAIYFASRQLAWRPANTARMWRVSLILGVLGAASTFQHGGSLSPADSTVLVLTAVLALGTGAAMGRIARFRPSPADPRVVESRGGWAGVGIWVLLVAGRVLIGVAGHQLGSELAVSTGMILLTIAVNRIAGALVISSRMARSNPVLAGR